MMRSSPLVIVLALTLTALAVAQPMTGTYTVDSSLPTGSGNYATLQEAANALIANGVSGPVIIAVNPGLNPYAGFSLVSAVPGTSAVNTVTFVAIGPVVISGIATGFTQAIRLGTAAVTTLTGPSYIIIEGFEVTGVPAGAGIIATGCTNITIKGCTVHTSGSGIYFGATTDSVIEDCVVYGVSNTCGVPGSSTYSGGISSYYNSHNVTIQRNRVYDCTGNGIFVGSSGSTTAPNNNIVINNAVSNTPGLGSYPGGIAIRRSGGSTFSNNSVSMPANSTFGGIHLQGSAADPQPIEISNNIIRHEGSGPCFRFETTTLVPPATFDYNLYDVAGTGTMGSVAATPVANVAAWQALLAPNMVGRELNSLEGPAGFTAQNDLHISPASLAFNSGSNVGLVTVDIDGQVRPMNGIPDRGCDETQGQGLFASFSAPVVSGSAPFSVSFADSSFTSDPGGITSWSWDFQNDGIVDSTMQNPTFNYLCPGTYSVSLTVTDAANPSSTFVRTNFITVDPFTFSVTSSGGGVADMTLIPVPTLCGPAQGTFKGYTLVSGATAGNLGSGPFFGIGFDAITLQFIQTPPDVGNVIHFVATPTTYPNTGTLTYPAGFFAPLVGLTLDAVMVFQAPNGSLLYWSNASRVSF